MAIESIMRGLMADLPEVAVRAGPNGMLMAGVSSTLLPGYIQHMLTAVQDGNNRTSLYSPLHVPVRITAYGGDPRGRGQRWRMEETGVDRAIDVVVDRPDLPEEHIREAVEREVAHPVG